MRFTFLACPLLFSLGCSWVNEKPGAESVALVKAAHVESCEKLGTASASVKHKMMGVERKTAKVSQELLTLAKNEAVALGGDTIVSESAPEEGSQSFKVYKCNP